MSEKGHRDRLLAIPVRRTMRKLEEDLRNARRRRRIGIDKDHAVAVIEEVAAAIKGWTTVAKSYGLTNSQIERMLSAFQHPERPG